MDANNTAIWGFSLSGGHVFHVAARNPGLAAAIAHSPITDGFAALLKALPHFTLPALLELNVRAALDTVATAMGKQPLLVPLSGPRGAVAALTTPDSRNGARALNPNNCYPEWQQQVAVRSAVRLGFYRPARVAPAITVPVLVVAHEHDGVTPAGAAVRTVRKMPRGELALLPGGHYEAYLGGHEAALQADSAADTGGSATLCQPRSHANQRISRSA